VSEGTVPIADVVKTAQCSFASIDVATRNGLIPIARRQGKGNRRYVTLEDALLIMGVAALAVAAGIAFGALLRAVRETGGQVVPQGLMIPVDFAASLANAA
jgi:hypothetical protein